MSKDYEERQEIKKEEISAEIKCITELQQLPQINHTDVNALKERITYFFQYCSEHGIRPTLSLMAVSLHVRRETLWRWEGENGERGEIISQAKAMLEAIFEAWFVNGRINPTSGIFCLKNNYGWKDVVEIETKQNNQNADIPDFEEIRKRLPSLDSEILPNIEDIEKKLPRTP